MSYNQIVIQQKRLMQSTSREAFRSAATSIMDSNQTQPFDSGRTVNFRCTCGQVVQLDPIAGGECSECKKLISAKVLSHELSRTWAVSDTGDVSHSDFDLPAQRGEVDLIGKSLGHFEIISTLGAGGMGQVYRALDKSLQRYVAVKVLSREPNRGSSLEVERLLQEAVAQARVNHPNIVSIYYVGRQDGDPFLAMELVPGKTISDRMQDGPMTFYEIVYVAWQIVQALKVSHELDIIHGDIKPSNILLQNNGVAKLSDFGMARSASSESKQTMGGTPNYLAPEMLEGHAASVQSDMYALGVTLYEMTFGRRPVTLSGNSVTEWARSHRENELTFPQPWPEEVPSNWRSVLQKLMARDPKNRFESYEVLLRELERLAPSQNTPAKLLPRMIAATLDYCSVGVAIVGIQILSFFLINWVSGALDLNGVGWLSFWDANVPWYSEVGWIVFMLLMAALSFVPIGVYTLVVGYTRQSLGRALMHLRVINRYGLRPSSRVMMGRSVLRMSWLWVATSAVNIPFLSSSTTLTSAAFIGVTAFIGMELVYMVVFGNGSSLHDRWYGTRVVIDVDQQ
ncbi:MAG: protein kinase [Pirellulaceae bacterium]